MLGWNVTYGELLARSIGADLHTFGSLRQIVLMRGFAAKIGVIGVGISTAQLGIGYFSHEGIAPNEDDYLNALQVGFGLVTLPLAPWWAIGLGAASLIITYNNHP